MASPSLQRGRISSAGSCYVVTTVTAQRVRLFVDTANAQEVCHWLRASDDQGRTESLAWVVMPDHVHWMFRLCDTPLSIVMRTFKSRSAKGLNQANRTQGAVWQPGYYDQLQRDDRHLLAEATYILANPLRAGLAAGMNDYPFAWCRWPVP
ncbi:REP-associated tyrosine transposase [Stenotrophomonas sp. GZD-301]|uniref:REP-associated tyrosine transposase n=1 Tax=Stenotrophomonas sp. GZD-301 TaxID=3404814 RepID=UPI003BB70B3F